MDRKVGLKSYMLEYLVTRLWYDPDAVVDDSAGHRPFGCCAPPPPSQDRTLLATLMKKWSLKPADVPYCIRKLGGKEHAVYLDGRCFGATNQSFGRSASESLLEYAIKRELPSAPVLQRLQAAVVSDEANKKRRTQLQRQRSAEAIAKDQRQKHGHYCQ
jgi:hypothetical protein